MAGWLVVLASILSGCSQQPFETVPGPESGELKGQLRGFVVKAGRDAETQDRQGLLGISLRDGREFVIKETSGIGTVAGPDSECRVVYSKGNQFSITLADRVCLRRLAFDGSGDETIVCRQGKQGKVMGDLALSADGRWVAFVTDPEAASMPGAYLERGRLEIRDLEKKESLVSGIRVLQTVRNSLAWFPDGRRLIYVDLVPRSSLPGGIAGEREKFRSWDRVPAVHSFDRETGQSRILSAGWNPIVSQDGASVLLDGLDSRVWDVDTRSGEAKTVRWRGRSRTERIALLETRIILYRGLPTAGTQPRFTKYGSFGSGMPMASLKAARLETGEFQTVVPYLDWRHQISFGVCDPDRSIPPR